MRVLKHLFILFLIVQCVVADDKIGLSLETDDNITLTQKSVLIIRQGATIIYDFNNTSDKEITKTIRLYTPPQSGLTKNYATYNEIAVNTKTVKPKISLIAKIGETDVLNQLRSIGLTDYQIDMLPHDRDNFHFSKKQADALVKLGVLDKNLSLSHKLKASLVYEWEQLFKPNQNTKLKYLHLVLMANASYTGAIPKEYATYDKVVKNASFCPNERMLKTLNKVYDKHKGAETFAFLEERALDYLFADEIKKPAEKLKVTIGTDFAESFTLCLPSDFEEEKHTGNSKLKLIFFKTELQNFKPETNTSIYFLTSKLHGNSRFALYDSPLKGVNALNLERLVNALNGSYREANKTKDINKTLIQAFEKRYKSICGGDVGLYSKEPLYIAPTDGFVCKALDIKDQIETTNQALKNNGIDANIFDSDELYDEQKLVGIGISVKFNNNKYEIVGVFHDSPAEKAGVKRGETIKSINNQTVGKLSLDDVINKLRGNENTPLLLELDGGKKYELTRKYTKYKSVTASTENNITVVRIQSFDKNSAENLKKVMFEKSTETKGFVIDIRDNGGGLLEQTSSSLNIFIDSEKPMFILGQRSAGKFTKDTFTSDNEQKFKGKPVVILVNKGTASGAALFAGVMQKHHKAVIVGSKTDSIMDTKIVYPLSRRYGLKISVGTLYYHDDTMATNFPVTPDIVFADSIKYDEALLQATKLLLQK